VVTAAKAAVQRSRGPVRERIASATSSPSASAASIVTPISAFR
jgi:hypothetical protein